jgi:hypothetical protein
VGHGHQLRDEACADGECEAWHVRDAQAQSAERGAEPPFPAEGGGTMAELDRERAAGQRSSDAGHPEGSRAGGGLEGRLPGFPGEGGDVVRVEERDEQDLGRSVEGTHDNLTATKR